jgi:uncharacterized oxidoreductase
MRDNHQDLNILINNAGIQRAIDLRKGTAELFAGEDEVEANFAAPIHLSAYFAPLLMGKKESAIVNISSGLGFVPIATMPVYCATKAGVHMFTISLRHQLKGTPVKVFEIVPPAVDTELGKGTTGESEYRGIPPSEVAEETIKALKNNKYEVVIGEAKGLVEGSRRASKRHSKNSIAGDIKGRSQSSVLFNSPRPTESQLVIFQDIARLSPSPGGESKLKNSCV